MYSPYIRTVRIMILYTVVPKYHKSGKSHTHTCNYSNLPIIRAVIVVNLDESNAVDEEVRAKGTLHHKLRPILKLSILLLQNLLTKK
jgi:hypothetical protein